MASAEVLSASREALTVGQLRAECRRRGLNTKLCVEKRDLEELLAAQAPLPAAADEPAVDHRRLGAIKAELDSWVSYGPRALDIFSSLAKLPVSRQFLLDSKLGHVVKRYTSHSDPSVSKAAAAIVADWRARFMRRAEAPSPLTEQKTLPPKRDGSTPAKNPGATGVKKRPVRKTAQVDDDDSDQEDGKADEDDSSSDSSSSSVAPSPAARAAAGDAPDDEPAESGWQSRVFSREHRGKEQKFNEYVLKRPFRCTKWTITIRIAHKSYLDGCSELLDQMARDFGAIEAPTEGASAADQQVLQRLRRLEERFRGNGVTEGEARNAMRLFERELSRANWTEEKFEKLKRQLDGNEEWSASDVIAESIVSWTDARRRQAWFSDASERVATPLGLESGWTRGGGCCFVGPLSSAAGAALTMVLVCHLADLDLQRALSTRGGSKISTPQFLQGFVDGALDEARHLIWQKLFSIEDDDEAARFCQEHLRSGFFDGDEPDEDPGDVDNGQELHSMLHNLFSAGGSRPARGSGGRNPPPPGSAPPVSSNYTPFTGKSHKLGRDEGESSQPTTENSRVNSWAITFVSNLELARKSRARSLEQAKRTYHWSFSGTAVKATKTGTDSYTKGRQAGAKRKGQIDGATGQAKAKFQRAKLAITQ